MNMTKRRFALLAASSFSGPVEAKTMCVGLLLAFSAVALPSGPLLAAETDGRSRPMKARVIQPLYLKGEKAADEALAWELGELAKCDESLDIVVLPEASDGQARMDGETFLRTCDRNRQALLKACSETAKRCKTAVFVNATDRDAAGLHYNTTFAFDTTGALVGKYRKQHLVAREAGYMGREATAYTREWNEPYVLTIDGVRYAFLTCYDFYFYEAYANIARMKPDIVIGCSHQRSDKLDVLAFFGSFCAYNTGAYLVRASVSMGLDSPLGGSSMVVAPDGTMLGNMQSRVGSLDVTFDPFKKYLKPAGYGNPPNTHPTYVEIGRCPWKYRQGGSAIVPGMKDAPARRLCAHRGLTSVGNTLAALGAASAVGAPEVAFALVVDDGAVVTTDGIPFDAVLRKLSCHVIMNIRLKDESGWSTAALRKLDRLIGSYEALRHVYVMVEGDGLLARLAEVTPSLPRCLGQGERSAESAVACAATNRAFAVQFASGRFGRPDVEAAHAAGLRCNAFGINDLETLERCRGWGVDTVVTDDYAGLTARETEEIVCEGEYDGHLQGVATDGTSLYWSHTGTLVKTDRSGKVLRQVRTPRHLGDLCWQGGKVYAAVNLGKFNTHVEGDGWVIAYDAETLSETNRWKVPEVVYGAGGMTWANGRFYLVGGLPLDVEKNFVYEYMPDFTFVKRHELETGFTHMGIQTAAFEDGRFLFGIYGESGDPVGAIECPAALDSFVRRTGPGNVGILKLDGAYWTGRIVKGAHYRGKIVRSPGFPESEPVYAPEWTGRGTVRIFYEGRDTAGWTDSGYVFEPNLNGPLFAPRKCRPYLSADAAQTCSEWPAVGIGKGQVYQVNDLVRGVRRVAETGEALAFHVPGTPEKLAKDDPEAEAAIMAILTEAARLGVAVRCGSAMGTP